MVALILFLNFFPYKASCYLLTYLFRSNLLKFVFQFIYFWTFSPCCICLIGRKCHLFSISNIYLPNLYFFFSDLERQLDEMRRPYLVEMVELWKTMGMGYNKGERRNVQKKRISPMVGFFKEQFEDLIKNDQKNLRDLTKEIERHCKERLELRRTLNITGNSLFLPF